MTRRAKMASFTGICEKALMTAATAFYPGKPIMEYTTVKILVYYFFYMGS
jgi:hypothetical protein